VSSTTLPTAVAALDYAARGILIFPLWHVGAHIGGNICACADGPDCDRAGKHPRTPRGLPNWGASRNLDQVKEWWTRWPYAPIGMPAGANRLAVIDVDPGHGGADTIAVLDQYCRDNGVDATATRRIRTGSGGEHRIYWEPPGGIKTGSNTFGPDAPGVDTRGRGGYVIAPPSLHACGQRYEVIDNGHTIAPWPACLTPLLERPRPEPARGIDPTLPPDVAGDLRAQRWAAAALTGECDSLTAIPHGEGNGKHDALNRAAYKIGRIIAAGWLNPADARDALLHAIHAWPGHPDRERVIEKAFREAAGNPHPGPAMRAGGAS